MKILRALPLLIVVLGCSGMSVAEPEQHTLPEYYNRYNERISQGDYDYIKDEIEKRGYADITIQVDSSEWVRQAKAFGNEGKPKDEAERKRQDEILDKLMEKVQKRKQIAVEAIRAKLDKEIKNGSRHFEIRGNLNSWGSSFSARIWGQEAFEILITVEEGVTRIAGTMPGTPFADELPPYNPEPTQTLDVFDTEAVELIQQPEATSRGYQGEGQLVAVVGHLIRLNGVAAGDCTAIGKPADTCRIVDAYICDAGGCQRGLIAAGEGYETHGDWVLRNILQTAPRVKFIFFDVVDYTEERVREALSKISELAETAPIAAVNMSFGNNALNPYPWPCEETVLYKEQLSDLVNKNIISVAASGGLGQTRRLPKPACSPSVVSVGGVYTANIGKLVWPLDNGYTCTDETSYAKKIPCFSNSAYFLDFLAPGAGNHTADEEEQHVKKYGGTSVASPNVAGAIAVLRAAKPEASTRIIIRALKESGLMILDERNDETFPLIQMNAAIDRLFALADEEAANGGAPAQPSSLNAVPDDHGNVTFTYPDTYCYPSCELLRDLGVIFLLDPSGRQKLAQPDGKYQYAIRACNDDGNCSGATPAEENPVIVIRKPDELWFSLPESDSNHDGAYTVNWYSKNANNYTLYEGTTDNFADAAQIYSGVNTSKSLSGRGDNSYYYWYWVKACNKTEWGSKCAEPEGSRILVVARPGVPSSISRSTSSSYKDGGQYTISWGAASGKLTAYELYEMRESGSGSGSWYRIYKGTNRSKYFDDKWPNTYYYKARACNEYAGQTACGGYTGTTSVKVFLEPIDDEPCWSSPCTQPKSIDPEPISE